MTDTGLTEGGTRGSGSYGEGAPRLTPIDLLPPEKEDHCHGPVAGKSQKAILGYFGASAKLPGWAAFVGEFKSLADDASEAWSLALRRFEAERDAVAAKARSHNLTWVEPDLLVVQADCEAALDEFDAESRALATRLSELVERAYEKCGSAGIPFDSGKPLEGCAALLRPRSEESIAADLGLDIVGEEPCGPLSQAAYGLAKCVLGTVTGASLLSVSGLLSLNQLRISVWPMVFLAVAVGCSVAAVGSRAIRRAFASARASVDFAPDRAAMKRRVAVAIGLAIVYVAVDSTLSAKGLLVHQDLRAGFSFTGKHAAPSSAWAYLVGGLCALAYVADAVFEGWKVNTSATTGKVRSAMEIEARMLRAAAREDEKFLEALAACNAVSAVRAEMDGIPARRAELSGRYRERVNLIEARRRSEDPGLSGGQSLVLRQLLLELRERTRDYLEVARAALEKTEGKLGFRPFWWGR